MKICQTIQKNMIVGGLIRNERPFDKIQLLAIFESFLTLSLQFVYIFRVAITPQEYMIAIFMTTAYSLTTVSYISMAYKTKELFDIIDAFELIINDSECLTLEK